MSLLKRLSHGFWSYVSPGKTKTTKTTPQTVPRRKPGRPKGSGRRRISIDDMLRDDTSMDPIDRVDSWRDRSPSSTSKQQDRKRKYPSTPSTSTRGRPKKAKVMAEDEMDYTLDDEDEEDIEMRYEDDSEISEALSNIRVSRSPSNRSKGYEYADSDVEVDTTLVVTEEEYHRESPPTGRRKIISPTTEHFNRGVDTTELREHGWDDDHITLMQKLSMRGFEPLMPAYWKFDYSFMPDALFSADNDAFVSSARGDQFRAIVAFEKLLEMGGRVRDRLVLKGRTQPEQQSCRQVRAYMKWADEDARLDARTSIPLVVFVNGPADTPATELQETARRRCARLADRWREALRATPSIETSPASSSKKSTTTNLTYPIPTLYAIIASRTLVALTAYSPSDDSEGEPQVKSAAFFDFADPAYDVWNSLAMAIVVCHVRNVQVRIAEETGVGARVEGSRGRRTVSEDPDA